MAALTNDRLIFHFLNVPILQGWLACIKRYGGGGGGGGGGRRRRREEEEEGGGGGGKQSEKLVIIENIHKSSVGMFQASAKCLSQQIDVFSVGGYKSKKIPPVSLHAPKSCVSSIASKAMNISSSAVSSRDRTSSAARNTDSTIAWGSAAAVGFVSRRMLHEEK